MSKEDTKGIIYIATGDKFVKEAQHSAEIVNKYMKDIPISLITDSDCNCSLFNEVIQFSNPRNDFGDQVYQLEKTPYDRTIFFDTDILLNDDVLDIFNMLDEFDFAAAHNRTNYASNRINKKEINEIPNSFPEYNSGVVAFKNNDKFYRFLNDWKQTYKEVTTQGQIHNQAAFRLALYRSDMRIATLPPRYNCIFRKPGAVNNKVKVFHGRLQDMDSPGANQHVDVNQAVSELNRKSTYRSFYRVGDTVKLAEPNLIERGIYSIKDRGVVDTTRKFIYRYL